MDVIIAIVVGIIAGFTSGLLIRRRGLGVIGDTTMGVVGALLGVWLIGLLNLFPATLFGFFLNAMIGTLIVLFADKLIPHHPTYSDEPFGT